MFKSKLKGYRIERKIKMLLERLGWKIIRAGASFGHVDLVCLKNGKCILLQIKSTKKRKFYYYGYKGKKLEGFPFYIVVDFGYNNIRVLTPKNKISAKDGMPLEEFVENLI